MRSIAPRLAAFTVAGLASVSSALASPVLATSFQEPEAQETHAAPVLLLKADRILVRPGLELEGASVLVRDGRIAAVGEGLEAPEGATVVEGAVITAGFLDAWSALGVDPQALNDGSASPATRTADALDPFGSDHTRLQALNAGITSYRVQAGLSSMLSGQGAVVRNSPVLDLEDSVILEDAVLHSRVGSGDVFQRLDGIEKVFSALEGGRKYRESEAEYEVELAKWVAQIAEEEEELEKDFKKAKKKRDEDMEEAEEEGDEFKEKRYKEDRKPRAPRLDRDAAVMGRVADGELAMVFEINEGPELRYFLERLEDFPRLRPILAGASDAAELASELAEAGVPVLLQPSIASSTEDQRERGLGLAGVLAKHGVTVLFGSGGRNPLVSAELPLLAALAVGHGLSREDALAALTTAPAQALDVDRRVGSVVRGKDADLLIWSGDPFESTSRLIGVVSGGELTATE